MWVLLTSKNIFEDNLPYENTIYVCLLFNTLHIYSKMTNYRKVDHDEAINVALGWPEFCFETEVLNKFQKAQNP